MMKHLRRLLMVAAFCGVLGMEARAQAPLAYGETVTGSIDAASEVDDYPISAQPGDVLLVRAALWTRDTSSGVLWPRVRVLGSSGQTLADVKKPIMAEVTVTVPAGGAGRILVSDGFDGTYTGGYHLYIQRLNEPGNAAPLALGTTEAAAVSLSAHMQTRSLTGAAGDVLVFRMANREENRSVTIWPLIRVYGPAGSLVAEAGKPTTADLTGTLPIAGAYTVLLGDGFDGTYTGAFGLFAQRVNDPVNAAPLDFARGPSGAIEAPGVVKTYTVALPDGYDSPLHLRMRRTGGDLWPRLRLYGPDGALLAEQKDTRAADISLAVPAVRTYTVLADDGFNGTLAGFYTIGWHYAFSDAARALRLAAGATPSSPAERARFDILASGALDITDAAWILRNATGLQYLP